MEKIERPSAWSRRSLLKLGAGAAGALLVAACGQSTTTTAPAGGAAPAKPAESKPAADAKPADSKPAASTSGAAQPAGGLTTANVTLQFMGHVAGGMNEQKAYDQILDEWKKNHPNLPVEYQVVPDADRVTKAQAMVAADQAPDMWRHNSNVIRLWGSQGHLLDLTDLLPANYIDKFLPGLKAYCIFKGRTYGLPHTTDTSALFYRQDAMDALGITPPTALKDAWTWQQWGEINDKLLGLKKQQYAFTHNQGAGRWVPSFLYSTGGKVVTDDFSKMAFNTPEGIEALTFVKSWSDKKWAPPAIWTTRVPNEDTDQFIRGTASMAILGQWNITYLDENIKDQFKWGVTFLPHAKIQVTSLGGTPIVGWAKTKYPKEVAAFFEFFTSVEKIKQFDEMANYVPVRSDMADTALKFQVRDDLMQTFKQQITTLPPAYPAFVARTFSPGISPIITEESTKMMLENQSPENTAKNIDDRGNEFIKENPDIEAK
jgi:ABC-type glycerol-3-phosphate transport system substrate-binding protein